MTRMKNFPPHLNFVAALPCKTNTSMNARVKLWRFCVEKHKTISPDLWLPNSPDLNPVDYKIWAIMQHRAYQSKPTPSTN